MKTPKNITNNYDLTDLIITYHDIIEKYRANIDRKTVEISNLRQSNKITEDRMRDAERDCAIYKNKLMWRSDYNMPYEFDMKNKDGSKLIRCKVIFDETNPYWHKRDTTDIYRDGKKVGIKRNDYLYLSAEINLDDDGNNPSSFDNDLAWSAPITLTHTQYLKAYQEHKKQNR